MFCFYYPSLYSIHKSFPENLEIFKDDLNVSNQLYSSSLLRVCLRLAIVDLGHLQDWQSGLLEQRISSDKASNFPKRDVRFILLK